MHRAESRRISNVKPLLSLEHVTFLTLMCYNTHRALSTREAHSSLLLREFMETL